MIIKANQIFLTLPLLILTNRLATIPLLKTFNQLSKSKVIILIYLILTKPFEKFLKISW